MVQPIQRRMQAIKKVLMIATDERYIQMQNGKFFSTGNHPVEMLLPMFHLDNAGFEIDVATLSGNPAKLEMWAMPKQEQVVLDTFQKYADKLKKSVKTCRYFRKCSR